MLVYEKKNNIGGNYEMRNIDQTITINGVEIANRLVMPPMATSKSNQDGTVSQDLCDYYDEKSVGGHIGLIITEHCYISKEGKASLGQMSIDTNCDIEGLKKLTDTIHHNDTKVFCQINHAGGATTNEITGQEVLSASSILIPRSKATQMTPREMNEADIQKVIDDFTSAALRAKEAGYDGVEIHSAHGYLLNQFYSPLTNHRNDLYNGSTLEGRIKLHLQVIAAVKKAVGDDYPIALRLGACDYTEGGSTIEDAVNACIAFEKQGVNLFDISGGFCGYIHPSNKEQGYFNEITQAIKEKVSVPVLLTGGIVDVQAAEQLLEEKKADLIGVGRAILKDSNWAKEAMNL